jgi:hypothetical protein
MHASSGAIANRVAVPATGQRLAHEVVEPLGNVAIVDDFIV